MAVAVNTPVIGLYAHHNPKRTGPYCYQDYVVSAYQEAIEAETGKPLSQQSWRSRVKDPDAMQRIRADAVIAMLDKAFLTFISLRRKKMSATKPTLAVALIVKNEADNLQACLESVKGWTDEIVVLDAGSTDSTESITRQYTDKFFVNADWPGFGPQRQLAQSYVESDYILC